MDHRTIPGPRPGGLVRPTALGSLLDQRPLTKPRAVWSNTSFERVYLSVRSQIPKPLKTEIPVKSISRLRVEAINYLHRIAGNAYFAYITILLLQIKVTWGMWRLRDLTSGDTTSYFAFAYQWFKTGSTPISWSPLYIWFYGSLLHLSSDAFVVTTLHRWLIVVILAVLVLALMRRLLPPELAWFMAAWWAILPIGFDALYEVHLFAVIPVLGAALLILGKPSPWRRGGALAMMVAASFLMRNELLLASGLLAAMLAGAWLWNARYESAGLRLNFRASASYVVPLLGTCLLVGYSYRHATDAGSISENLERKHTLNICQTYAFGYQQRHSDFTKSPWSDCQVLMMRTYGEPEPTLMEALRRNPAAMMEHFLWNVSLIPDGLQVLLFNVSFGKVTPDYAPVRRSLIALPCTFVILGIVVAGGIRLLRNRRYWWDEWLKSRVWGWLLLMTVGCVTVGVMISQRPRPSYMFSLGILLRAVVGMCLLALIEKSPWRRRLIVALPIIAVAAVALTPSFYERNYKRRPRPLVTGYERIVKYEKILRAPSAALVSAGYDNELCDYAGKGECRGLNYYELRTQVSPARPWPNVLDASRATVFYADEEALADPVCREFILHAKTFGWQTVASQDGPREYWRLLHRISLQEMETSETSDITLGNERLRLGSGWHDSEVSRNVRFRWSSGDGQILLSPGQPAANTLSVDIEPGPSVRLLPLLVQVLDGDGKVVQIAELGGRATITIQLPPASAQPVVLVLHATDGEGKPVPHDPRILKYRVFKMLLNW